MFGQFVRSFNWFCIDHKTWQHTGIQTCAQSSIFFPCRWVSQPLAFPRKNCPLIFSPFYWEIKRSFQKHPSCSGTDLSRPLAPTTGVMAAIPEQGICAENCCNHSHWNVQGFGIAESVTREAQREHRTAVWARIMWSSLDEKPDSVRNQFTKSGTMFRGGQRKFAN